MTSHFSSVQINDAAIFFQEHHERECVKFRYYPIRLMTTFSSGILKSEFFLYTSSIFWMIFYACFFQLCIFLFWSTISQMSFLLCFDKRGDFFGIISSLHTNIIKSVNFQYFLSSLAAWLMTQHSWHTYFPIGQGVFMMKYHHSEKIWKECFNIFRWLIIVALRNAIKSFYFFSQLFHISHFLCAFFCKKF